MGFSLMCKFHDLDRIFDAIIYTSRSDQIMRYSDEVRVRQRLISRPYFSHFCDSWATDTAGGL